ncbi:MAG: hypothetical protein KGZ25_01405, partial [Planctomycetes bacterium]|nr:hypothetical protein [Planctomycetota bacterium]
MTVNSKFLIGWSSTDITPEEPIVLRGQFHARVSEGVNDPVTATVLALAPQDTDNANAAILVSCDLVGIPDCLRDSVREQVGKQLPELDVSRIILNATHTHTGPELSATNDTIRPGRPSTISDLYGVELPVMEPQEYTDRVVQRITRAVVFL